MTETCLNCRYHSAEDTACHRWPPEVYFDADEKEFTAIWPPVGDGDWCGEFAPVSEPNPFAVKE